ncbi:MAG: hydantoinase/oxoprolinase family protein [Nocardioides sp.]|uniref:hydantoinase/oxoprolinase family protein n=1 Tax=Nocardioides sp. TaxID=35761 RepID=UPI0039E2C22C
MNRVGVECGGTFTDLIVFDDQGGLLATHKVFSTPLDPSEAVVDGLRGLGPELLRGAVLYHGSTVATNALIERKGARVGFLTTAGFEDVPFLQRQDREEMYDLGVVVPQPLTGREMIRGVVERVTARGKISRHLDEQRARAAIRELAEAGAESFAVSTLHSYANTENEDAVARLIEEIAPGIPVSRSSAVSAEFREFERATTTIADAFLKPRIAGYLERLEQRLGEFGVETMYVMLSNGGIVPARTAANAPISMLRSGPAAGVAGAIEVAGAKGIGDIVTMDMGGTSTDVAVVRQGSAEMATQLRDGGLPINVAHVDIVAVGAGGGSIVDVDQWGLLNVGPESAGADPGPISYGRGGERITVTDIDIMREFLRPEMFLGGSERLHPEGAWTRLAELAERTGRPVPDLLEDVYTLVNVNMANAVRIATTERGIDPTEFDLFAYGGAGPLHAAKVAEDLKMRRVIVPPNAGIASAFGLLAADFKREYSQTWFVQSEEGGDLAEPAGHLFERAAADLEAYGLDIADGDLSYIADMRYRGQGFEIAVEMPHPDASVNEMLVRFNDHHAARYGHADRDRAVQIVTIRLTVRIVNPAKPRIVAQVGDTRPPGRRITVFEGGESRAALLFDRAELATGESYRGPVIVTEPTSTTFVPSGWTLQVDELANLTLERG